MPKSQIGVPFITGIFTSIQRSRSRSPLSLKGLFVLSPLVSNGHLKPTHSSKATNNLWSNFQAMFLSQNKRKSLFWAKFFTLSGQLHRKVALFIVFYNTPKGHATTSSNEVLQGNIAWHLKNCFSVDFAFLILFTLFFFVYFSPLIWTKKCHVSYTSSNNLEKKLRHSFPLRKAESFLIKTNDADSVSSSVLAYDGMILSGKMPESIRNEIESDLSGRINEFFLTAEYNTFNNSKCQPSSHSTDDFFSFTHFYFFNFISKFSQLAGRNLEHCY